MVVIGIIAVLLIAIIPAITSLTKASGRKAAVSSLLGGIEQARANAIKTGRASYIVFPTFTSGSRETLDRYDHKSFAIFEDDPLTRALRRR
jgi:type II secretory pathway pseudopilin PulG